MTLGLLPGGGGVTRTVRMFGIQNAFMNVLSPGHPVQAGARPRRSAWSTRCVGSVDELVPAAKAWIKANPDSHTQPWDAKGYKMPGGTPSSPALAGILPSFPALLRKQLKGAPMPAPRAILDAAVEGAQVDFDTASRIESRYFTAAGHRPGRQEHDPGVLLRPADTSTAAARGPRASARPRSTRSACSARA